MNRMTAYLKSLYSRAKPCVAVLYRKFIYPRRRILLVLALCGAVLIAAGTLIPSSMQDTVPDDAPPTVVTPTDTGSASDLPPHDTAYHFDDEGMLLYDTYGHYVQAQSYSADADIPWQLRLVNDWNPMPRGYDEALTLCTIDGQTVDDRMADALTQMLKGGSEHGLTLVSGFRAASLQHTLYWNKVGQYTDAGYNDLDAQLLGGTVVKRPGFSEHNTGLAADLGGSDNFRLEEDFADTPAFAWLIEHCADYGFILRFPQGKEDITGVIYEPWHYRYVGIDAAREIMSQGLCLEEYLAQTQQ